MTITEQLMMRHSKSSKCLHVTFCNWLLTPAPSIFALLLASTERISTISLLIDRLINDALQSAESNEKRSDRRKHCALAVVRRSQKYSPRRRPPSGAHPPQDGQTLVRWRWSLPSPKTPVWWGSMHTISSYRGNRPTNPQTNKQDRLQYTAPLSLARSV